MKNIIAFIGVFIITSTVYGQEIYSSKTVNISFFSSTPVEDIDATTKNATAVLTCAKNEFVFLVQIKSFTFDKSLMQEHFNDNYMESDKFPNAQFKCKINEPVDYKKDGTYKVTATGKLSMHGVEKERTINGIITVKGNLISISSEFDVVCKDHDIKIPTLLTQKIAETIKVKVNGDFTPYKKM